MPIIPITVSQLGFRVKVTRQYAILVGTDISLTNYVRRYNETQWDARNRRLNVMRQYRHYDATREMLYLPRCDLQLFLDFLEERGVSGLLNVVPPCYGAQVDIQIRPEFPDRNEFQTQAITSIVGDEPLCGIAAQPGCLTGDTEIYFSRDGEEFTLRLEDAYLRFNQKEYDVSHTWSADIPTYVRSLKGDRIDLHMVDSIVYSGMRMVYRLILEDGKFIKCTADHEIMTDGGWVEARNCLNRLVVCDNTQSTKHIKVVAIQELGVEPTYDICCKAPYHNFVANGIVVHNSGKTFAAIKALSILGRRSLITVAGLTDQWVRAIHKFTTTSQDGVYLIQGADSLRRLHDQIDTTLFPKIIVASIPTLRPYAQDPEVEALYSDFDNLMHRLNVGVRVIDEAHLNFHANFICDLRLNPAKTIVLTATFDNARPDVKKIFDAHYPPEIRFGEGKFERYVDVYAYEYGTGINDIPHHQFKTPQGYSHVKFETWLLKKPTKMEQAWTKWRYPISANYDNIRAPGERLLLLFATRVMCEEVQKRITAEYPHLTNTLYLQEHGDEVLEQFDVIISTLKKAGTGRDISRLRTAIAYISIDSTPTNLQVLGRLRTLPNGVVPEYVFMYHRDVKAQVRHADKRHAVLKGRARRYYVQPM